MHNHVLGRTLAGLLLLAGSAAAQNGANRAVQGPAVQEDRAVVNRAVLDRANALYQRTDYNGSLQVLAANPAPSAETHSLQGKNYFMLGDFKKATDALELAVAAAPANAEYVLWLGRAYGRRAETSGWLKAGFHASKARQWLEKAVELDPHYNEALNDLFAYYLEAPGFLGGGMDKAEGIALRIREDSLAEYQFAQGQMAEKRKEYSTAEGHFRRAMELAPREVGRIIDLAAFLARRGRMEESETVFAHAQKVAPTDPRVDFARAKVYVEHKRSLGEASRLLKKYLEADVTPDDPPKAEAEQLLKQAQGS